MGSRAALIVAVALVLSGCSALDGSNGVFPDMASYASDLGAVTDGAFCVSVVTVTASPGPDVAGGFVYAPTDLYATATAPGSLESPMWTVSTADGQVHMPEIVDQQSGLRVKYHADAPGSYTFRVTFAQAICEGQADVVVHAQDANSATYRLRISPPDVAGIPQQDQLITIFGNASVGAHDLSLVAGTPLQATLRGPSQQTIAGEVRFLADSGPDALGSAGSDGVFALSIDADAMYTPLLIPKSPMLAPVLLSKATGAQLAASSFVVDAGETVSGTILDPADAPISGVKVVLRAGALPSGVGLSDGTGSFALQSEPGAFAAQVGADGWPELALSGVTVPAAALSFDVKYLVARVAVSGKVVASDGTTPLAGARVSLRSSVIAGAATINVGGTPLAADGRVNQVVLSAADGSLPALQLPLADYDLLVEPPAGAADGVTRIPQSLQGAGNWTLALQAKAMLSGKIKDASGTGVDQVRVTAFETAGLGAAPYTFTSADGSYTIAIDRGSPVNLLIEPPDAAHLAGGRLALAAGVTQADASLGPGLRVAGYVIAPGGGKLPSVSIDALCGSCGSPTPIASAISGLDGFYSIYLPDPGLALGDGGVTDSAP